MQKWSRNVAMGNPWLSVMWSYSASMTTFAKFRTSSMVSCLHVLHSSTV